MPRFPRTTRPARLAGGAALIAVLCGLTGCGDTAKYALQATIQNLDSSGLTLDIDGGLQSVPAGATSQTLAAAMASGTHYIVVIASQPAADTCSLANGTGTIAGAAATVAVTCVPNSYSVGGTIKGLTADGLVLRDNGADSTAISANATLFTMPTAVAMGDTYAVTVQSQPSGLTCSVSGGTGTMGAGGATVTVTCAPDTYSVSGTISGLTSGGLVLLDNGADATAIGVNATQFMMPTAIAYGSPYSITIQTQPSGLTCSVTSGAGTMGLGGATVAVSCIVNVYTVGGTVSGLTAGGLVLLDNGADTKTLAANAAQFTIPTPVAYGSTYAVTVQTQPPGLVCTVSNGTGPMGAGDVTNVAVACQKNTSILYFFQGGNDGSDPLAPLLQAADGNFYGTTYLGGAHGDGIVFEVTPAGVESVLHTFSGSDGNNPEAGLIEDANGNFFGATTNGGSLGFGTVYKIATSHTETVLHSFVKGGDGGYPICTLAADGSGNYYGTTWGGGLSHGIVFKITSAGSEQVLHSFADNSSDGGYPTAGLVRGTDGNYYGTTGQGGSAGKGTFFKTTPTGTETLLYAFAGGNDGATPASGVIEGSDGNFYGTTASGGTVAPNTNGTVFKVTPAGTETVLYSFAGQASGDGSDPAGGLLQASDGNFYGTTKTGGTDNDGTVFKLTPAGVETVIYSFTGGTSDGANPVAALIRGSDGNLYGTTTAGGPSGDGSVFVVKLH
jgi:uncharacterized repeat protein (TIGR03803 family)